MTSKKERLTVSLRPKNITYLDSLAKKHKLIRLKEGERQADRSKTLDLVVEEHSNFSEEIKGFRKENEELKEKLTYVEDYANGKREELYKKATTFPFHKNCYDMIPVEGDPDARECLVNPRSLCPVNVPKDKKTGKYIIRDPRICGRCQALDLRKTTERPTQKKEHKPDYPVKSWCKRDRQLFTEGEKDCYNCKWLTTECTVKRRVVLNG